MLKLMYDKTGKDTKKLKELFSLQEEFRKEVHGWDFLNLSFLTAYN